MPFRCGTGREALRPDSPRLILVIGVEQREMRVPCCAGVRSGPELMIFREPKVVRNCASSGRSMRSAPDGIAQYLTTGELSPL